MTTTCLLHDYHMTVTRASHLVLFDDTPDLGIVLVLHSSQQLDLVAVLPGEGAYLVLQPLVLLRQEEHLLR